VKKQIDIVLRLNSAELSRAFFGSVLDTFFFPLSVKKKTRTDIWFHNSKIPQKISLGKFSGMTGQRGEFVTPRNEVSHTANHVMFLSPLPNGGGLGRGF